MALNYIQTEFMHRKGLQEEINWAQLFQASFA